jgi:hypothetical protein
LPIEKGTKRFLINQEFEVGKPFSTVISGTLVTGNLDHQYDDWLVPETISLRGAKIHVDDAFVIIGALDPESDLSDGTEINEDDIIGFMFGGGEDQLGYFVLKRK